MILQVRSLNEFLRLFTAQQLIKSILSINKRDTGIVLTYEAASQSRICQCASSLSKILILSQDSDDVLYLTRISNVFHTLDYSGLYIHHNLKDRSTHLFSISQYLENSDLFIPNKGVDLITTYGYA